MAVVMEKKIDFAYSSEDFMDLDSENMTEREVHFLPFATSRLSPKGPLNRMPSL